MPTATASRTDFLLALHEGCEGLAELRALPSEARTFRPLGDDRGITRFAAEHSREDVYIAVATRKDATSGRLENCQSLAALFVDLDYKTAPAADARAALARFPLSPSAIVRSGNGLHAYWLLREPMILPDERDAARGLLRRLAIALGGDLNAAEPARVLRLPGTFNFKYEPPRPVELEMLAVSHRYNPCEFDEFLPPEPASNGHAMPFSMPDAPLAEGEGRNSALYRLTRALRSKNLNAKSIVAAVEAENARFRPPLSERELHALLEHALTQPDRSDFTTTRPSPPRVGVADTPAVLATPARQSDVGNAQRLVAQHGHDLRYVYARRAWLHWDGTRWRWDEGAMVAELAKATARSIYAEAAAASEAEVRKALAKHATYSSSEPGLRRMVLLAQSEPGVPITMDELDREPYLLGTPSGVVDLRTGLVRAARREDYITKSTAVAYDPDARHPVFDAFLGRVLPNEELRGFVQCVAGYCLTASTVEEKLFLVHGPTAGGKSTFLAALRRAAGDYATTADATTFMDRKMAGGGPRDDLVKLVGRRFVVSSEVKDGTRLAESLVKTLFGGDDMAARGLYERTFEFTPRFKLLIASNHRPRARDDDDALWRRLLEIPFTISIAEAERDPAVKATLCDPAQAGSAILAWAVRGAVAWLASGLAIPEAVRQATAAYRDAMDPLADFLTERCILEPLATATTGALRDAYDAWAKENGIRTPLGARAFADRLRDRGCKRYRQAGGTRAWRGVRLRTADDLDSDTSDASDTSGQDFSHTRAREESLANGVTCVTDVTDPLPRLCARCHTQSARPGFQWCSDCFVDGTR